MIPFILRYFVCRQLRPKIATYTITTSFLPFLLADAHRQLQPMLFGLKSKDSDSFLTHGSRISRPAL